MTPPPSRLFVGVISGTSVDGLDLALLDLATGIHLEGATTEPFSGELRDVLLGLGQPGSDDLDLLGRTDRNLGRFIGEAVLRFLDDHAVLPARVVAIGSHGQTVRHRPEPPAPFTWQIGDPNQIAEITGIATIADFRRRDMAAGGQGAPLVPLFHEALFAAATEDRVAVNIGGIGNITVLPGPSGGPVGGFDTGPGNALLDTWCEAHTGRSYDAGGAWAATGKVIEPLLSAMLADAYFQRAPPKSTGREAFNLAWLNAVLGATGTSRASPEDVQRTLTELTAASIADALPTGAATPSRIIICGGGRHNTLLLQRLAARSGCRVETAEDRGFDGDAIESAAFAWLAARHLDALPGNASDVTGASGPRVLGALYPA